MASPERDGLTITVAHYRPGASKSNPIEHRLLSEISKNWAGRPLDSYQTILNYIRTTRPRLAFLRPHRLDKFYDTGRKVSDAEMRRLAITGRSTLELHWPPRQGHAQQYGNLLLPEPF